MAQRDPTSILHRTAWRPPIAVGGKGIYLDLGDGRRVIDAVGGAAVSCLGNGHPKVIQAMKDQLDKVACTGHRERNCLLTHNHVY